MNEVPFYLLSYDNSERKQRMINRFTTENVPFEFVPPVEHSDPRIVDSLDPWTKRVWSIMLGHLDMLKRFIESGNESEYAIFCEDDIYIRKGILTYLPEIISSSRRRGLDIVLLGYLLHYRINNVTNVQKNDNLPYDYNLINMEPTFQFYKYPDDVWGTQMYMLSRRAVTMMLEKYNIDYAISTITDTNKVSFCADTTLTKDTFEGTLSRALIHPMLAVEEGPLNPGQINSFQGQCAKMQFNSKEYH